MSPEQSTQTDTMESPTHYQGSQPQAQQQQQHQPQELPSDIKGYYEPYQQQTRNEPTSYQQYSSSYGQPFNSYMGYHPANMAAQPQQEQGQQQQIYQAQPFEPPEETKGWRITKLVFHIIIIVSSIIGLGLALSLLGANLDWAVGTIAASPVFVVAGSWSIAEVATRFARKWVRGIHPGAHVGMCLILWLGAAIVAGMMTTFLAVDGGDLSDDEDCYDDGYDDGYTSYGYGDSSSCNPHHHRSQSIRWAVADAFMIVVFVVEFILFIGGCVDTAKYNAAMRRPIMIMNGPPQWGPAGRGYQAVPNGYGPPGGYFEPRGQTTQQQQPQQNQGMQDIPLETREAPVQPVAENNSHSERYNEKQPEVQGESSASGSRAQPGVTEYYTPNEA